MAQVIDPVCGMTVDTGSARQQSEYQGQHYYFCSPGCKKSFDKEPEKYLNRAGQDSSAGEGGSHGGHSH